MADPAEANPFDALYKQGSEPEAPAEPQEPANPFDAIAAEGGGQIVSRSSFGGALLRSTTRGALPAYGGWAAAGAGLEAGAAAGLLTGPAAPIAEPVLSIAGAVVGGIYGSRVVESVQNWALKQLPDSWTEALGQSDRQQKLDQETQGTASFLGGMLPYTLAMRPGAATPLASLPENPTALHRLMANPVTARLFGGVVQGGMELGNEVVSGQSPDWAHVAIATGFGLVFNKPTKFGEAITEMGARPARGILGRPDPTLAQVADAKVAGAGMTESVFRGTEEPDPAAMASAHDTAATEAAMLGTETPAEPDLHAVARQMHPETFAAYDALSQQRDTYREWLSDLGGQRDEAFPAREDVKAVSDQIDTILDKVGGVEDKLTKKASARLEDLRSQFDELHATAKTDTPEMQAVRKRLMETDEQMRDLSPEVSAAYRRAEERTRVVEEPAEPAAAPETTAAETPPESLTEGTEIGPTGRPITAQRQAIVQDVSQKLIKAGRPEEEASAAAQIIAARYETRAARFEGAKGTAEELYSAEAPDIRAGRQTAKERELELAQGVTREKGKSRGKIKLSEGRAVITLMKDADASTVIHEQGHAWLEELMRDAADERAPPDLVQDSKTVLDWLKATSAEGITTRQHEKFARGFEQYMREGVAPSKDLAGVFAQFRDWLTKIYETIKRLGAPISEDIRGVFDRMLAVTPERTVLAPERETLTHEIAKIHELDAAEVEPRDAEAAMARVAAEQREYLTSLPKEVQNEIASRLPAEPSEPGGEAGGGEGETGGVRPDEPGSGAQPRRGGGGANAAALGKGGGEAGREGAGASKGPDLAPGFTRGPNSPFPAGESALIDRAGNIRIENLTDQTEIGDAIRDSAARNNDFQGARGGMTKGQMMDLADAMGVSVDTLNERKLAQVFGGTENLGARILAARKLLIESAGTVSNAMKAAAESGSDADAAQLAVAITRHDMIQSHVAGVTAEWGRAGNAFHSLLDGWNKAQNLDEFLKANTGRTLFQLKDMAKLGAQLETPQQISKFIKDSRKRNFWGMVLEYWINGLISGPAGQMTYNIGTTGLSAYKATAETGLAAVIGRLREVSGRQGERVYGAEVSAQLHAAIDNLPGAVKASAEALRAGRSVALPGEDLYISAFEGDKAYAASPQMTDALVTAAEAKDAVFSLFQGLHDGFVSGAALLKAGGLEGAPLIGTRYSPLGEIPGITVKGVEVLPLGTAARLPSRVNAAMDSFFRMTNYSMEKAALATRAASVEGLTGAAREARIAELIAHPTEAIMGQAAHNASELSMLGKGGKLTSALMHLINTEIFGVKMLKFVSPFVRVASNVIDQSLVQRSPLGLLSPTIRADLMGKNGNVAQDFASARMLAGSALSLLFGSMAASGAMTGSGPADPRKAAVWRMAGYQPYSVRIGDTWYSMKKLDPFGTLAGVAADLYDVSHAIGTEDADKIGAMLVHSFAQNILDASFMRGPSDLIKAINQSEQYGDSYVRNFLSSFTPYSVGISQVARAIDPYSRQARTIMDAFKAKIPGLSEELLPRRDLWGEPLPNSEALIAKGLTAIYESRISSDPVNIALAELGIGIAQPERRIRNVKLTDQQFDDYSRIAGRMTKSRLDVIIGSPDFARWPPGIRQDVVNQVVRQCREAARGMTMLKYPQIMRDATRAKLDKFQGAAAE
jgi:hypothetical protein